MSTKAKDFFERQDPHNRIKSEIVAEYFKPWANIIKNHNRGKNLVYLDLFSGSGYFKDGKKSTPILIFDQIAENPSLLSILETHFYEDDKELYEKLEENLKKHEIYKKLKYKPIINNTKIDKGIIDELPISDCCLTFIDPCGVKGISDILLNEALRNWGCDCILFYSTMGIRRLIETENISSLVDLFGIEGLKTLKKKLKGLKTNIDKNKVILNALDKILNRFNEIDDFYSLKFAFEKEKKRFVTHYLIFLTKYWGAFKIMKQIMHKHSVTDYEDIPLYLYSPILEKKMKTQLPLSELMPQLKEMLISDFKNQTLTRKNLYELCHRKKYIFTESNMMKALFKLAEDKKINIIVPDGKKWRKNTFPEWLIIKFK